MNLAELSLSESDPAEAMTSVNTLAQEMRQFLELGAVQLEAAIKEADSRVNSLAMAVTAVATDARELQVQAHQYTAATGAAHEAMRSRITELADALSAHVRIAVTSLQFYDKLIQRLSHVRDGLVIPADRSGGAPRSADWDNLLEQVRGRYSMVEERVLFDFMMRGLSADQMLKALTGLQEATPGDLELF
ncbi:MAG: hypothetical protein QM718_01720 [Steroidobacteraceae bacterium]